MITPNLRVLRIQLILSYTCQSIIYHVFCDNPHLTEMLTFHMFHTAETARPTKINKTTMLHRVTCYKQDQFFILFGYFLSALLNSQEPITSSILLQQTLERKWKSLLFSSLFSMAKYFFVVRLLYSMQHQILHKHNQIPHKRTWNINSESNINNKQKQPST